MKLLVIADDFTGALDTAVQFTKKGLPALVYPDNDCDIEDLRDTAGVLVINSESRHLPPGEAYKKVKAIVEKARTAGREKFYKKTDSALRGNIGSELAAVLEATGEKSLYFFPAYPKNGRTTKDGIQYVDGMEVACSVFGKDPFEPVLFSYLPEIIRQQSDIHTEVVAAGQAIPVNILAQPVIYIFDSETDRDLQQFAAELRGRKLFTVAAGCAGFAEYIPALFDYQPILPRDIPKVDKVLFVSGSLNPVTLAQLDYARTNNYPVHTLEPSQELQPGYCQSSAFARLVQRAKGELEGKGVLLLASSGELADLDQNPAALSSQRAVACGNISMITESIMAGTENCALVVFGGDTALGVVRRLFCGSIRPLREIEAGVVASEAERPDGKRVLLVTKSGGFGAPDLIERIIKHLLIN